MAPFYWEGAVMRTSIAIAIVLAFIPAVASAEEKKTAAKDPNRIICEKQEVLGSRLSKRRICMPAAEWAVRRQEDRQAIEKTQTNKQTLGN